MKILTSLAVFAFLVAGSGATSACDWAVEMAKSYVPTTETKEEVAATKVDPKLLAWLDRKNAEEAATQAE